METNDLPTSDTVGWGRIQARIHRIEKAKKTLREKRRARSNTRIDGLVIFSILPAKDDESLYGEFNQTPTKSTHISRAATNLSSNQNSTN